MKSGVVGLVSALALTVSAGAAVAADKGGPRYGSVKDAPPPQECCQANWSGLYIGAAVGTPSGRLS